MAILNLDNAVGGQSRDISPRGKDPIKRIWCIFYSPGGEGRINRVLNFSGLAASWHGMSVSFPSRKLNPGLTTIKKFLERGLFMKYIK